MAPCPSDSALDLTTGKVIKGVSIDIDGLPQEDKALDLSDKLYAGKIVVPAPSRTDPSHHGQQYRLPGWSRPASNVPPRIANATTVRPH